MSLTKKCKSRNNNNEEEKEEWIYSYGDMVTLLLLFFVIMYSTTEGVSQHKADQIRNALASAGLIAFSPSINSKERDIDRDDMDMVDLVLKGGDTKEAEAYATSGSQRLTHIQPDPERLLRSRTAPSEQQQERIESLREFLDVHFPSDGSPHQIEENEQARIVDQVESYQMVLSRILTDQGELKPQGRRWLQELATKLKSSGATDRVNFRIEPGRDRYARGPLLGQGKRILFAELQRLFPNSQASPHAYLIERLGRSPERRPTRSWLIIELRTMVEQ